MNKPDAAAIQSTASTYPHGLTLLRDPLPNKGTAISEHERDVLGVRGLLPAHVLSTEEQAKRMLINLWDLPTDLEKYPHPQTNGDHRCRGDGRRVYSRRTAGCSAAQRAANRVCPFQSNLQIGMHRRRSLPPHRPPRLFACGSPYPPAEHNGWRQGNNSYIFPGIGLGAIASGATRITDDMFMNAALALAECVNNSDLEQGSLYPALPRIRGVSAHIAARVAHVAYGRGLTSGETPDDMPAHIKSHIYEPHYHSYA